MAPERRDQGGAQTAVLAHEVQNALEAIGNYLHLAQTVPAEAQRFLQAAEGEVQSISRYVRSVLQDHRPCSDPQTVDLAELVEQVLVGIRPLASKKGCAFKASVPKGCHLAADPAALRQVFRNLLKNAIDAIEKRGMIALRVHRWGRGRPGDPFGYRVSVSDNGRGIPAQRHKQIFQPFYTSKMQSGNGIGLWVTQEIIHRHHGKIRVRSSQHARWRGTTFMLFIPISRLSE